MLLATGAARTCLPSHGICKCSSIETYDQDPPADDGLWHEAHLETRVSYHSTEVLAVIGDIERWVDLFPWCSCSTFLHEQESGRQYYKVHFGLSMGPVFIGDIVTYEVTRSSSSLKLVAVNGQDLKYCDFLVYTFTMRDGLEDGVTEVNVSLQLHARRTVFLKVWQALEKQLVNLTVSIVRQRLQESRPVSPIDTPYTIRYPDACDAPLRVEVPA